MAERQTCPDCGNDVPHGSPLGLCPACLVAAALAPVDTPPQGGALGRIGEFALIDHLGEGGFGDVYLAEQRQPVQRTVALKVLKRGMDTRAIVARFAEEQQVLASLDHPGICRLYEAGETPDGRPFFAMELVPGVALSEFAKQPDRTERQALKAFRDACRAVAHAHSHGIVHRDLKPSNILVADDGTVKVIDFGLAKAVRSIPSEVTHTTQVFGTPEYLAPECADGSRKATPAADVFALGRVLVEIGAPCGTQPLAERAMHPEPARRFPDAGDFCERIDAVLEGRRPQNSWSRRRVLGLGLAACAAVVALFLFLQDGTNTITTEPVPGPFGLTAPFEVQSHGYTSWGDGEGNDWFLFVGANEKTCLLAFDWVEGRISSGHWSLGGRRPGDSGTKLLEWGSPGDRAAVALYQSVLEHSYTPDQRSAAVALDQDEKNRRKHPLWEAMALQKHLAIRTSFQRRTGYRED